MLTGLELVEVEAAGQPIHMFRYGLDYSFICCRAEVRRAGEGVL